MALAFLPDQQILPAFQILQQAPVVSNDSRVAQLVDYVSTTWMSNASWTPASWCVYRETVRTNNDVEGWHHRLNVKARRGQLDIYQLAPLLHKEATFVHLQTALVSERRLRRRQRKGAETTQGRLHGLWSKYEAGDLSTSKLLRAAARLYAPVGE